MRNNTFKLLLAGLAIILLINACTSNNKSANPGDPVTTDTMENASIKPSGPAPEWGKTIKPEMQAVIEKLTSYGDKPIETLSAGEARKTHSPADAVRDLAEENHITIPDSKVDTTGRYIDANNIKLHLRIYTPKGAQVQLPVIVYYHGGGFAIGNIDTYHATAQALATQVNAIVVSVAYRLAPENKFPTAHNDAFAAYEWVVKHAADLNGDPAKIAVAGESAGANLAANVSVTARDKKIMLPLHQLLIYPIAQSDLNTDSYKHYATAKPLNKAMMEWFSTQYLNTPIENQDQRIVLVNANLKGLPATTIITAEIDPLHDDGVMLANKLSAAGVQVNSRNYEGVTHEFFGMGLVIPEAKAAVAYAATQLKAAFK